MTERCGGPDTIACHAGAALAEGRLDRLACRLGARVLEAVRGAEFSFLLRSGKCADWNWIVDGEPADFFVGSVGTAFVPDDLYGGFPGRVADRAPCHWR